MDMGADAGFRPGTIDSTAITDGSVDTIDLANDAVVQLRLWTELLQLIK